MVCSLPVLRSDVGLHGWLPVGWFPLEDASHAQVSGIFRMVVQVLIVSRVHLYGEGLAHCLDREDSLEVVGVATRVDQAIDLAKKSQPNVILYDLVQPDALAGAQQLLRSCPGIKVVALAVKESENAIIACAEAGLCGYVAGDASLADLRTSIFAAVRGELACSPRIAHRLLREVGRLASSRGTHAFDADRLTAREWEILQLIERGLSNLQIAAELEIGPSTVKNHVHHILEKLNVSRRGEAAALARRSGDWAIRELAD